MGKGKHPYELYENSSNWKIIKEALEELILNNDVELMTPKEYVIGYLCKALKEKHLNEN